MSLARDLIALSRLRLLRLLALTALIVGVGIECFLTKLSVLDPDMWWHLSVGDWIVQNRSFPHNGIFSHTAATRPWMAYSWGYEALLSRAYGWFSFIGMGTFGTLLTIGVALAIFRMLYRISGRFWAAWGLSVVVYAAFLFNIAPRPVFFSVILFTITLTFLFEAQRNGSVQSLYWLPLVFLIWANIHIQFIYGLAVVGLFAGVNLLQRIAMRLRIHPDSLPPPTLPAIPPFAVLACCILASCIGPYSYHLYYEAFVISQSKIMYKIIRELQALSFQYFNQYLELLLAVGAYFAIGWKKKIDPFKFALLIFATVFAFRTWRDAWFICVGRSGHHRGFPRLQRRTRSSTPTLWLGHCDRRQHRVAAGQCAQHRFHHARPRPRYQRRISGRRREFPAPQSRRRPALQQLRLGRIPHLLHAPISRLD